MPRTAAQVPREGREASGPPAEPAAAGFLDASRAKGGGDNRTYLRGAHSKLFPIWGAPLI